MLRLWSTATQSWGCHCRGCIRTTAAIGRQASTARTTTSPRRRKALASDVFIACYSAIMATAAVIDAAAKDRRRLDLDRQIAEARTKLARLMEDSMASDLARLYESSPKYHNSFVGPLATAERPDPIHLFADCPKEWLLTHTKKITPRDKFKIRRTRKGIFFPNWNDNWVVRDNSLRICNEAIATEENIDLVSEREPKTDKQFEKMTDMINDLVDQLLRVAYDETEAEAPGMHPPMKNPESAYNLIRMLKSDGYPSYQHPSIDPEKTIKVRARVNEVNQRNIDALAEWSVNRNKDPRFREHYVAKICYNLLVSDVPPGIRNYNSLILGFTKLGEHNLAHVVVNSFIYNSHMKPTRATMLCVLQHYRLTQDVIGFRNTIRRILGYDNRGFGLRRKTMDQVIEGGRSLRRWVGGPNVTIVGDYAVEIPQLDWAFYEIIMEGLLDFRLVQEAVDVFLVCLRNRFIPDGGLVNKLLHGCIESLDESVINALVDGLLTNIEQTSSMLFDDQLGKFTASASRKIRRLLAVRSASLTNIGTGDIWTTSQLNAPSSTNPVGQLVSTIWINCLMGEVEYWNGIIQTTQQRIFNPDSEQERQPLLQRVERAIKIFDDALARPVFYAKEMVSYHRLAKLEWLRRQCNASAEKIRWLEGDIYHITKPKLVQEPQLDDKPVKEPHPEVEPAVDEALYEQLEQVLDQKSAEITKPRGHTPTFKRSENGERSLGFQHGFF